MMKIVLLVLLALPTLLQAWDYPEIVFGAGQSWHTTRSVPNGYKGRVQVVVATNEHTCGICGNEEVALRLRGPKNSDVGESSDDRVKMDVSNLPAGSYTIYIDCKNENNDCDLAVDIQMSTERLPTPQPTNSPTPRPPPPLLRNLTKALECDPGFSRQAGSVHWSAHEYCGCTREDNICNYCCTEETEFADVERRQYDDLRTLPLFYGKWKYLSTGSVAHDSTFEYTFTQGVELSQSTELTEEVSTGIENSVTQSTGFELGVSVSVGADVGWVSASASVSSTYSWEETVGITQSSQQTTASSVAETLASYEEVSCSATCSTNDPNIVQGHAYQWVTEKWDGTVVIKTCSFWCSYIDDLPPLCPLGRCGDASCTRCTSGTFSHPQIDEAASSYRLPATPTLSPTPEPVPSTTEPGMSLPGTIGLVAGVGVLCSALAVMTYRKLYSNTNVVVAGSANSVDPFAKTP